MPSEAKKAPRWLVIIEKKPRGPITESEIRTLMAEGVLRANDLALLVLSEETTAVEWKFLWQYPEFDRRKPTAAAATPKSDRRAQDPQKVENALKERTAEITAQDLRTIDPEQLSLHSSGPGAEALGRRSGVPDNVLEFPKGSKASAPAAVGFDGLEETPPKIWKYLGVLSLTVFAFAVVSLFFSPQGRILAPTASSPANDSASANSNPNLPSGNPLNFSNVPRGTASSSAPRALPLATPKSQPRDNRSEDRGDILRDNREREYQGWRERDEEQDDAAASEDEGFVERPSPKKGKKAKPKKRALDSDEEIINEEPQEPDAEAQEEPAD